LSETRGYLDDLKVAQDKAAPKPKKKPATKTGKVVAKKVSK